MYLKSLWIVNEEIIITPDSEVFASYKDDPLFILKTRCGSIPYLVSEQLLEVQG